MVDDRVASHERLTCTRPGEAWASPPLWSALQAGSFPWAARPLPPVRHPPSRRTVGSWVHRELRACHAISTTHEHHTRVPGFTTARPQETSIGPDGARVPNKVDWPLAPATWVDALELAEAALRSLCGTQHARVAGDKCQADSIPNPRRTREDLQLS
jgi:hypothetical protein